jgi:hypothetical protein
MKLRRLFPAGVIAVFLLGMLSLPFFSGCAERPPRRDLQAQQALERLQRTLRAIEAQEIVQ